MRRLVLVLWLGACLLAGCGPGADRQAGNLTAGLKLNDSTLTLTNQDKFAWESVRVRLNPADSSGGFVADYGKLLPGQSKTLPLLFFTNRDGGRFKYETMQANQVAVTCQTPTGRGAWTGGWQK